MLYLSLLGVGFAETLLKAGPPLVLLALFLMGVAALMGFRGELVRDD